MVKSCGSENKNAAFRKKQKRITKFVPLTPESNSGLSSSGCGLRIYMYIHPATSAAATHFTRHILPRHTTHGRGFRPIATAGSVPFAQQRKNCGGLGAFFHLQLLQCYPRFKNLSSGCKSLELCADVASDVGIKAKSRLLRFL